MNNSLKIQSKQDANICDFKSFLNVSMVSADRILSGRAFQRDGAAETKAFSPRVEIVLLTVNCLLLHERRFLPGTYSETRFCKYFGAEECTAFHV